MSARVEVPGSPFWLDGGWVPREVSDTFPECPLCREPARDIRKPYGGLGLAMHRLWWPCCGTVSEPKDFIEWAVRSAVRLVKQTRTEGKWPQHAKSHGRWPGGGE